MYRIRIIVSPLKFVLEGFQLINQLINSRMAVGTHTFTMVTLFKAVIVLKRARKTWHRQWTISFRGVRHVGCDIVTIRCSWLQTVEKCQTGECVCL